MTTELYNLALVSTFTAVMWVPYLLNRLTVGPGLAHEVGYPKEPTQMSPWAVRLMKSHENSLGNLTVFAPLVIAAHLAGVNDEFTAVAAVV